MPLELPKMKNKHDLVHNHKRVNLNKSLNRRIFHANYDELLTSNGIIVKQEIICWSQ